MAASVSTTSWQKAGRRPGSCCKSSMIRSDKPEPRASGAGTAGCGRFSPISPSVTYRNDETQLSVGSGGGIAQSITVAGHRRQSARLKKGG
jgi:hypothetical protein